MTKNFLNNKLAYSFSNHAPEPVGTSEPLDLTSLTIKIGFVGITVLLGMSLVFILLMALT